MSSSVPVSPPPSSIPVPPSQSEKDMIDALKSLHDLEAAIVPLFSADAPPSPPQILAVIEDIEKALIAVGRLKPLAYRSLNFAESVVSWFKSLGKRKSK